MASDKPSVKRDTPAVEAFQKEAFDTIYPEGEIISIDTEDKAFYIVRQGSIATEMLVPAPDGLKKIDLDTIEAGEYFHVHALFGSKNEHLTNLRYRTQCQTVVMRVTFDMLPKDPKKLSAVLKSFMQTAAKREDKLRQLTGYAMQRTAEKKSDRKNGDILFMQSLREEVEDSNKRLKTIENTNAILRRAKQALEAETRSAKEALDLERRTRQALEKRVSELTKSLAARDKTISQSKFPAASYLLESRELQDLEAHAKRFHEAALHFEELARKMHRALELMAEDNPGMYMSHDVMMLLTGEEPQARPSVVHAKASHESGSFRTLHFGSEDPALTGRHSGNVKQTDKQFVGKSQTEKPGRLSQTEMQSILAEFTSEPNSVAQTNDHDVGQHTNDETWGVDDSHYPPSDPPTKRIHEPSRMNTLVDGAQRAAKISGKHLPQNSRFSSDEPDSDITPIVPEYPASVIQTTGCPPVEFPDEGTDIRQIQEEWRSKLQPEKSSPSSKKSLNDMEWIDSDDMRTTQAYQFPAPGKPPKPEP